MPAVGRTKNTGNHSGPRHTPGKTPSFQGISQGTPNNTQAGLNSPFANTQVGGKITPAPLELLVPFTTTQNTYKSTRKVQ